MMTDRRNGTGLLFDPPLRQRWERMREGVKKVREDTNDTFHAN